MGSLNAVHLWAHGLTPEWINNNLFYILHLLLPICDPKHSRIIDNNERMTFFSAATTHTNGYVIMEKCWGRGCGHKFKLESEQALVHQDSTPIWHDGRDSSTSSLQHRHWLMDDTTFDPVIVDIMSFSQLQQIKGVFKLNNNLTSPSGGKEEYDPTAKYDLIFGPYATTRITSHCGQCWIMQWMSQCGDLAVTWEMPGNG
jgi:hypothetical protein